MPSTATFHNVARRVLATTLFAAGLSGGVAAAEEDARALIAHAMSEPTVLAEFVEVGRKSAFFCVNCHGDEGTSRLSEVPNLAGQNPDYLLDQIEAFLSGKRKNEFMQGLMKVLSERDKATIVLSYAAVEPVPAVANPGPLAAKGEALFGSLCVRCHQTDARGAASFPRLAGQQTEYLKLSLKRYLDMSGERIYPPMTGAIRQLGEANIPAMVEYLASKR